MVNIFFNYVSNVPKTHTPWKYEKLSSKTH